MTSGADRASFEQSLVNYTPDDSLEKDFKAAMLDLLKFEHCFERKLKHAHFTGSAWVVDLSREKVLLTHHAKLDKWLQLGGHADGNPNICAVAQKELQEESGSCDFHLHSTEIFDIDIHSIPAKGETPEHDHYDIRFLFEGDSVLPLEKNHESKELRWVSFQEVPRLTQGNQSILRMLNKTIQMAL